MITVSESPLLDTSNVVVSVSSPSDDDGGREGKKIDYIIASFVQRAASYTAGEPPAIYLNDSLKVERGL